MPSGRVDTDSIACSTVVSTQSSRTITPSRHCQPPSRSKNSGSSVSFFFTVWELNMFDTIFSERDRHKKREERQRTPRPHSRLGPYSSLRPLSSRNQMKFHTTPSEATEVQWLARTWSARPAVLETDDLSRQQHARILYTYRLYVLLSGLDNSFAFHSTLRASAPVDFEQSWILTTGKFDRWTNTV